MRRVRIIYTYRPIAEAFAGVLTRARIEGRTVSIDTLIRTHEGAARTAAMLYGRYGSDPNVRIRFIDNSGANPKARTVALTKGIMVEVGMNSNHSSKSGDPNSRGSSTKSRAELTPDEDADRLVEQAIGNLRRAAQKHAAEQKQPREQEPAA